MIDDLPQGYTKEKNIEDESAFTNQQQQKNKIEEAGEERRNLKDV